MQELHNVKGSRKNGIYVDCKQLAMRLYKLSFTMAKRDRVIFGDRMLSLAIDCVEDFAFAYQYPERRVEYTERLIFDFGRLKELMRMSCDLKIISTKHYVTIFEYVARIDEGVGKYRKYGISKVQAAAGSNDGRGSGNERQEEATVS